MSRKETTGIVVPNPVVPLITDEMIERGASAGQRRDLVPGATWQDLSEAVLRAALEVPDA